MYVYMALGFLLTLHLLYIQMGVRMAGDQNKCNVGLFGLKEF